MFGAGRPAWGVNSNSEFFTRLAIVFGDATRTTGSVRHDCLCKPIAMKVKILNWHAVASWTWDAQDDACGICRQDFD
eukprot:4318155-Pyramimonas_sp.AAC.1